MGLLWRKEKITALILVGKGIGFQNGLLVLLPIVKILVLC